jgi:sialate O-acetylesterase
MDPFMKSKFFKSCRTALLLLILSVPAHANVKLPALISDGMILQRDSKVNIWGWASSGEQVTIRFAGKVYRTTTDSRGKWKIVLPPIKAGGPYTMEISGQNQITVKDILIGDVWFCSGQSNMVLPMERVKEKYPNEYANDNYPEIRNFFIPTVSDVTRIHEDLPPGRWQAATHEGLPGFGALTYFFAKNIYQNYKVPIGIINSSVGGTPIEAWISEEGFKELPRYAERVEKFRDTAYINPLIRRAAPVQSARPNVNVTDKGLAGPKPWYDVSYVPEGWHKFWLPGYWADQGVKGLNGVVWFRKEIIVPASMTGKPGKLFMGRIVDADNVYVNGVLVGSVTYQYPPRRYDLPSGLLREGKNIVVVKVTNTSGKGGFVPDKPYFITAGGENIDLRGDWQYQVGQVFSPVTSSNEGMRASISQQNEPTGLYNTMVAPAVDYTVKGFLWYQGESNSGRADDYKSLLPALIYDWRMKWNQGVLPFLYVQLPNFMEVQYLPSESDWAELREAQLNALSVPNTAMAVTIDVGEWNDIHPLEKRVIGERLSLAARNLVYGEKTLVYSGPIYKSSEIQGDKIIVSFNMTGGGLISKDGRELDQFAIAGKDKKFVWAEAKIEGDKVIVWSEEVAEPQYVRYAWADNPESANLYNKENLPASPFMASPGKP